MASTYGCDIGEHIGATLTLATRYCAGRNESCCDRNQSGQTRSSPQFGWIEPPQVHNCGGSTYHLYVRQRRGLKWLDRHKLIHWVQHPEFDELYDLKVDPREERNVIKEPNNHRLVERLRSDLGKLVKQSISL